MKTKLTLLAAVILAGIGTTVALAGLDTAKPTAEQPAGMSCCAKMQKDPATTVDKGTPASAGTSCHSDATAKAAVPVKTMGCCKK